MIRTLEAVIDEQGNVRLLKPVHLPSSRRALVTILDERQSARSRDCDVERGRWAEDWNRPEEDEVTRHLQQVEYPGAVPILRFMADETASRVVLVGVGPGDWILCQVTSQPYGRARAIKIENTSLAASRT